MDAADSSQFAPAIYAQISNHSDGISSPIKFIVLTAIAVPARVVLRINNAIRNILASKHFKSLPKRTS